MEHCERSGGFVLAMCRKKSSKYMCLREHWWVALDIPVSSDPHLSALPEPGMQQPWPLHTQARETCTTCGIVRARRCRLICGAVSAGRWPSAGL